MSGLHRRLIQTTIALLLVSWLPVSAHADEIWTVVVKKTHFGPGLNTLVLKPRSGTPAYKSATVSFDAGSRFLVISRGNVYLAVDEQAPLPAGATVESQSTRWPHKKLVQIGQGLFRVYCYRCFLFSDDVWAETTLQFTATGVDPFDANPPQELTTVITNSIGDESTRNRQQLAYHPG